jgi:hypothetical protein
VTEGQKLVGCLILTYNLQVDESNAVQHLDDTNLDAIDLETVEFWDYLMLILSHLVAVEFWDCQK